MSGSGYNQLLERYRRYAPQYERKYARYSEATLGKALDLVPDIEGDLLDVACGTGLFIAKLRQHRHRMRIIGVDISPEMLEQARARFAGDDHARFVTGTAERLPADDGAFDIVACNNAFHLVQDGAAALREFRRVLRDDGRVIIIDWCRDAPQMAVMTAAQRLLDRQVRNVRGLDALARLIEANGFSVIHRERFRAPPMWGLMAVSATVKRSA